VTTHAPDDAKPATAARIYDYMLGGTHNFPADREAARQVVEVWPLAPALARNNRAFLRRVVRMLTDAGIGQFLDLGSGIPTAGNVHELAPEARVVYVDIDPVAVAESLEILHGDQRATALRGDLQDPEPILAHPDVRRLISFDEPVALLIVSVLHFVPDDTRAQDAVARFRKALAPGSYLALSHGVVELDDLPPDDVAAAMDVFKARTATPLGTRSPDDITRFFGDFELVEPGLVRTPLWRPAPDDPTDFANNLRGCNVVAGVARKP
jgi:SAM-dependent methyltransferase